MEDTRKRFIRGEVNKLAQQGFNLIEIKYQICSLLNVKFLPILEEEYIVIKFNKYTKFHLTNSKTLAPRVFVTRSAHTRSHSQSESLENTSFFLLLAQYLANYKSQFLQFSSPSDYDLRLLVDEQFEDEWKTMEPMFTKSYVNQILLSHSKMSQTLSVAVEERLRFKNLKESDNWRSLRSEYLFPVSISVDEVNDTNLLIVRKPILVLSKHQEDVESQLKSHGNIKEVHFIASKICYVDASLENSIWHGKNVLVCSDKVICIFQKLLWDVSGLDGSDGEKSLITGGIKEGEDGKDGCNGQAGESGGNITIMCQQLENLNWLTIKSNGGKGGRGQNGGHGKNGYNGRNGNDIPFQELLSKYPSPVKLTYKSEDYLLQIIRQLKSSAENIQSDIHGYDTDGKTDGAGLTKWIHLKGIMESGVKFEFGYSRDGIVRSCYILLQGENGEQGRRGGRGGHKGLGGSGGFSGFVKFLNLQGEHHPTEHVPIVSAMVGENGRDGEAGKDGESGCPGRNGKDVGYIDCTTQQKVKYFKNGKFKITNLDNPPKMLKRCYCAHRGHFVTLEQHQDETLGCVTDQQLQRAGAFKRNVAYRMNAIDEKTALYRIANMYSEFKSYIEVNGLNPEYFGSFELQNRSNFFKSQLRVRPASQISFEDKQTFQIRQLYVGSPLDMRFHCSPLEVDRAKDRLRLVKKAFGKAILLVKAEKVGERKAYFEEPTVQDCHSALHALFGEKNEEGFYKAEEEMYRWAVENLLNYLETWLSKDSNIQSEFLSSLQTRAQNFTRDGFETPEIDGFFQSKEYLQTGFDWGKVLKTGVLAEYTLSFFTSPISKLELQMLANASGIRVVFYQNVPATNELVCDEIDVDTREMGNVRHILLKSPGEYARIAVRYIQENFLFEAKCVRETMEHIYNNDKFVPLEKYSLQRKLETFCTKFKGKTKHQFAFAQWSLQLLQYFHDILATSDCNNNDNLFLLQIVLCIVSEGVNNATDWSKQVSITILHDFSNWAMELMLHYIALKFGTNVGYRERLSRLPKRVFIWLLNLISSGDQFQACSEAQFVEFLNSTLKKSLEETDYSLLNGLATFSEWQVQLEKICMQLSLSELYLDGGSIADKNEIMYYLYNVSQHQPNETKAMLDHFKNKVRSRSSRHKSEDINSLVEILQTFHSQSWQLDEDSLEIIRNSITISDMVTRLRSKHPINEKRRFEEIVKMLKNTSTQTLTNDILNSILGFVSKVKAYSDNQKLRGNLEEIEFKSDMVKWVARFREECSIDGIEFDEYMDFVCKGIGMVNNVVMRYLKHELRHSQTLVALAALYVERSKAYNNGYGLSNLLTQVHTGEGKSWIVITVAIVNGLFGRTTDVITSSSILARRDAHLYEKIYKSFGLSVGEVTMEDQVERARQYNKTVVYGEVSNFERDYLIDHFYDQNVRGSRKFDAIVIDEVDSMFLDKGNSLLYLSHRPPDLSCLEPVFVHIWNTVLFAVNSGTFDLAQVNLLIRSNIFCDRDSEDRRSKGKLSTMNFLKPFVDFHLMDWITNAYKATQLVEGEEYVIDFRKIDGDRHTTQVMIVDLDTGVDLHDTQWDGGLHQFLQLKHGCYMTPITLKAVFISNVTFFNMYSSIFGLTGTLGSEVDCSFLRSTYNAELLFIPTALPRQFTEECPIVCASWDSWKTQIHKNVLEKLRDSRSVLILCETIKQAESLFEHLSSKEVIYRNALLLYRRGFEQFDVTLNEKRLSTKTVIVATNLAGRGTDIRLDENLQQSGGLHVIFSYLPANWRILWQGFGRAGRCGDPGSGKLIFVSDKGQREQAKDVVDHFIEQNQMASSHIKELLRYYHHVIVNEECMFNKFQVHFDNFSRSLENAYSTIFKSETESNSQKKLLLGQITDVKDLLKHSMIDEWAFWLDKYSKYLTLVDVSFQKRCTFQVNMSADSLLHDFDNTMFRYQDVVKQGESGMLQNLFSKLTTFIGVPMVKDQALKLINEPSLLIKLGKTFISQEMYEIATQYFQRVIDSEPNFSHTARYYKLYCSLKLTHWDETCPVTRMKLKNDIDKCLHVLNVGVHEQVNLSTVIQSNIHVGSQKIQLGKGFVEQRMVISEMLQMRKNELSTLIPKKDISCHDFLQLTDGDLLVATQIYELLGKIDVISPPKVCFNEDDHLEKVKKLAKHFGLSSQLVSDILKEFNGHWLDKDTTKLFKSSLNMPSCQDFWRVIKPALEKRQVFAIFLHKDDALISGSVNDYKGWLKQINLNNNNGIIVSKYNTPMDDIRGNIYKGTKSMFCSNPKFLYLRQNGMAWIERVAVVNIDKLKSLEKISFDRISKMEFVSSLGEANEEKKCEEIYSCLQSANILNSSGILQNAVSRLPQNVRTIFNKNPLSFEETQVINLICTKCCYQHEILKLIEKSSKTSTSPQHISKLSCRPAKQFILECIQGKLVEDKCLNISLLSDNPTFLEKNFDTRLTKSDVKMLYPKCSDELANGLWKAMEMRRWIDPSGLILYREDQLVNTPVETFNRRRSCCFDDVIIPPEDFQIFCAPVLLSLLRAHLKLSQTKFVQELNTHLKLLMGKLYSDQKVDVSCIDFLNFVGKQNFIQYHDAHKIFASSGLDHVIAIATGNAESEVSGHYNVQPTKTDVNITRANLLVAKEIYSYAKQTRATSNLMSFLSYEPGVLNQNHLANFKLFRYLVTMGVVEDVKNKEEENANEFSSVVETTNDPSIQTELFAKIKSAKFINSGESITTYVSSRLCTILGKVVNHFVTLVKLKIGEEETIVKFLSPLFEKLSAKSVRTFVSLKLRRGENQDKFRGDFKKYVKIYSVSIGEQVLSPTFKKVKGINLDSIQHVLDELDVHLQTVESAKEFENQLHSYVINFCHFVVSDILDCGVSTDADKSDCDEVSQACNKISNEILRDLDGLLRQEFIRPLQELGMQIMFQNIKRFLKHKNLFKNSQT